MKKATRRKTKVESYEPSMELTKEIDYWTQDMTVTAEVCFERVAFLLSYLEAQRDGLVSDIESNDR